MNNNNNPPIHQRVSPFSYTFVAGWLVGHAVYPLHVWLTRTAVCCSSFSHGVFTRLSCTALRDGHCSGFAHNVLATSVHCSLGRLLLQFLSMCVCLFRVWLVRTAIIPVAHGMFSPFDARLSTMTLFSGFALDTFATFVHNLP